MNFEYDILLTYDEKDDVLIEGGEKGWVTNFERFLRTLSSQISKDELQISRIRHSDLSIDAMEKAAIVLIVVSPNTLKNKALIQDAKDFVENAINKKMLFVEGSARIFKIVKFPADLDGKIPELENIIPYDFYQIDPLTGEPQEFKRFFGTDAERGYWLKMVDLAYDVIHVLESAKGKGVLDGKPQIEKDKTVYLASTGVDMVIQRDIIKRELLRHGYRVLPEHSLPKEVKLLELMVREDLAKCRLSIHLVGEDYGYKPKGSDLSIVDIQNRMAGDHTLEILEKNQKSRDKDLFSRLIWLSPDLKNVSERQKIFVEDLKSDAASLDEAEVLQITLQEFKSIIREELVTGGRFKSKVENHDYEIKDDENLIYLICDKLDLEKSKPLLAYLEEKGFGVVSPVYEGDLVDVRYIHQENLRRCDASIIYYGTASEEWIKTKLQDLLKAPGFGRSKPFKVKAVYIDGKKEELNLQQFERNNAMVLGDNGGFKPEYVDPFLDKLVN